MVMPLCAAAPVPSINVALVSATVCALAPPQNSIAAVRPARIARMTSPPETQKTK